MSDQDNVKAAQSIFTSWNMGDLSKTKAYEADNFMTEAPGAPGPLNSDQNQAYVQNFFTAFPGSKFELLLTLISGDYVVTHWKITGVNAGPLMSPSGNRIPPTNKTSTLYGSSTAQVKNGKVVHGWTFFDMATLLGQLGLLPPM